MKALSLYQPYASLIALGVKNIETRGWATKYSGPLAIHASLNDHFLKTFAGQQLWGTAGLSQVQWNDMPFGAVVAVCELAECAPIGGPESFKTGIVEGDEGDLPGRPVVVLHPAGPEFTGMREMLILDTGGKGINITKELPFGDYSPNRFAWLLADVKLLDPPVPAKGKQGVWEWPLGELIA